MGCVPNYNALLSQLSANLVSLDVEIEPDLWFPPSISFDHPCLVSTLQTLTITVEAPATSDPVTACTLGMGIVEVVTYANLRNLEELRLEGCRIDLGRVGCLSKLGKLKSLAWACPSRNHLIAGEGEDVVGVLEKVFESRVVKPKITFDKELVGSRIQALPNSRWPFRVEYNWVGV
jgi:hypothetical protein